MEVAMSLKKFVIDLSDEERLVCEGIVKKLKGSSQRVKRANILLKADKGWTDTRIAEALDCRVNTVENLRKRFVEMGFEQTLQRKKRATPPVEKILNGEQEAKIIAMRLGDSPKGFGKWTLRLLARKIVERNIAPAISYQTVARTLKKTK
jgi:transposase